VEEVLGTLDDLVRAGKIRYIAARTSRLHLMKSLAVSSDMGWLATSPIRPITR